MKNVYLILSGLSLLVCFVSHAQEKSISKENKSVATKNVMQSLSISKDTINAVKSSSNLREPLTQDKQIIICAPSRPLMNEPMYVLDGDIIDSKQFSKVNPNDIEFIKVLKEKEATALYGNKAINGAIVITTKKKD